MLHEQNKNANLMARRQVDLNFKWQSDFCMNTVEYQGHFSEAGWQDTEKQWQQNAAMCLLTVTPQEDVLLDTELQQVLLFFTKTNSLSIWPQLDH